MGTKIRSGGQWVSLENTSGAIIPTGFGGSWTNNTSKSQGQFYTNTTGKLIYVSATFRVRTVGSDTVDDTAGSSAWGYVSSPNSTSTNLADYFEVGRVRDNGTVDAENLYLNIRFFVPQSCKYIVRLYNNNLSLFGIAESKVSTIDWSEFELNLTY